MRKDRGSSDSHSVPLSILNSTRGMTRLLWIGLCWLINFVNATFTVDPIQL